MNKKIIWIVVLVVIIAGGWYLATRDAAPVGKVPIKIGFIASLSGVGSAIGNEELKGAQLAVEEINQDGGIGGRPIELVAEDLSLDKIRTAGSVTQKLIDINKVVAIVGPQWDELALAIVPIVEERKVPTVSQNITSIAEQDKTYNYLFSVWPSNEVGVKKLLEFARQNNWSRVAIVQPGNFGFWELVSNFFVKHAPDYGVTVVARETGTDLSSADYRTLILKAKAANPDAVFGTFAEYECAFIKQATELDFNVPLISTESAGTPAALSGCRDILQGRLFFSTPRQSANYNVFVQAYQSKHSSDPQFPSAVTAYDAVRVVVDSLRRTRGASGETLRQELGKTDIRGASMPRLIFDQRGYVVTSDDAFEIQTVQDGQFVRMEE